MRIEFIFIIFIDFYRSFFGNSGRKEKEDR